LEKWVEHEKFEITHCKMTQVGKKIVSSTNCDLVKREKLFV